MYGLRKNDANTLGAILTHMRQIILTVLLSLFTAMLFGQTTLKDNRLLMTHHQNRSWLKAIMPLDKADQWNIISDRFFSSNQKQAAKNDSMRFYPLLVIDGIPLLITDSLSGGSRTKLASLLTINKISEIRILDREPDGLYVNRAFTGVILVTLNDKKTRKRLRGIELK
jgi:hypothetical protein